MRDRTQRFQRYRDAAFGRAGPHRGPGAADPERSGLLDPEAGRSDDAGAGGAGPAGPGAEWERWARAVAVDLGLLEGKVAELEAIHARAALTRFDAADGAGDERLAEVVAQEATGLVARCKRGLDGMSRGPPGEPPAGRRVRENARRKLALALQGHVGRQRAAQKRYLQKLRDRQGRGGSAVFQFLERELGAGGGAGGGGDALDAGFNAAQLQRLQQSEGRVDEREKEVMGVMQSINDLMEVMHDLSVLVIDQGTMLDRIDYHVEQVAGHVESGVLEIERAERTQKQSRNWLVIGVLLALVLVMAVIVMVRYA